MAVRPDVRSDAAAAPDKAVGDDRGAPASAGIRTAATAANAVGDGASAGRQGSTGTDGQPGSAGTSPGRDPGPGRTPDADGRNTQAIGGATSRRGGLDRFDPAEPADPTTAHPADDGTRLGGLSLHRMERAGEAGPTAVANRPAADAADRILGQVIDRLRSFSTDGTPGLETRFEDPQLGSLRLVVSGRVGETVHAEIIAFDPRSADAIGRAIDRAATTSIGLHGIALQVRTGDSTGAGSNGHAGGRRDDDPRDPAGRSFDGRGQAEAREHGRGNRDGDPALVSRPDTAAIGPIRRRPTASRPTPVDVVGRPTGRPGVDIRA